MIFIPHLKKMLTATLTGGKVSLDVNVSNTSAVPVASSELSMKDYRLMDFSMHAAPAGAWTELGNAPGILSANAVKLKAANNSGESLLLGKGPDAATVTVLAAVHAGQASEAVFGAVLSLGDRLWIKPLLANLDAGQILVTTF